MTRNGPRTQSPTLRSGRADRPRKRSSRYTAQISSAASQKIAFACGAGARPCRRLQFRRSNILAGGFRMSVVDQLWILVCAALVFLMQIGFMCVEAGITRSKNNINVAIKNLTDFLIAFLLYCIIGFGIMFGPGIGGVFGQPTGLDITNPEMVTTLIFQAMFCGTAATIISGAVAERCAFVGYIAITVVMALLIYPVFGHWAWADNAAGEAGWLRSIGFYDFAGGGVVHALGGAVALAAILVVGPREGRFLESGGARRFNGSNLPQTMLGVFLLWLGWLGFNGGSVGGFEPAVSLVLLNTMLGGSSGAIAALAISWSVDRKPSAFLGMNGALGGLVAITAGADLFNPVAAVAVGVTGGLLVYVGDRLLERWSIDDAVGAVPVHLFNGIWGLVAAAIFGTAHITTATGMLSQLAVQILGAVVLLVYCFGLSFLLLKVIDRFMPLRVTQHIETIGLNVGEHGANTDLNELLEVMQRQARERDLSMRAPQSPFTEIGQIGLFYNSVMFELDKAFKHLSRQSKELEDTLTQKDRLLESILPKAVAERMRAGEDQIVDQVSDATVVFVDIVDFTSFSQEVQPHESINLLRNLFGSYDEVIHKYDLEKIKTIGDCYMFVAGLHDANGDHCSIAIEAALDVLFETRQTSTRLERDLQVRIGVHSGPLVAGVVGELRFVYDLWGSTVNLANRIEEAGKGNEITVSQAVIDRVGSDFLYERAGRPRLRGVGPTVLYVIRGRRTTLARRKAAMKDVAE